MQLQAHFGEEKEERESMGKEPKLPLQTGGGNLDPTGAGTAPYKEPSAKAGWVVQAGTPRAAPVAGSDPPACVSSPTQTSQCMWLMQALGFLLSALQVEEILKNLHSLITPYIQQLEKLADETVSVFVLLPPSGGASPAGCVPGWCVKAALRNITSCLSPHPTAGRAEMSTEPPASWVVGFLPFAATHH